MAMTHEEELSELAADVTIYVLFAAMLLAFVADQACAGGWGCAVAHVVSEIWAQAILVLLLLPLALVLFFLRAADCSSKAADAESLSVKDVEERPSGFSLALLLLLLVAMFGTFSFAFYMYGYPDLADLYGHAALLVIFLCEAFVYVRAALSLWRMNPTPKPSNMVAAEEQRIAHLLRCAGSRAGRSKMMESTTYRTAGVLLLRSTFLAVLNKETDMHVV